MSEYEKEYLAALKEIVPKPDGHKKRPDSLPLFGVLRDGATLPEHVKISGRQLVFLDGEKSCSLRDLAGKGPTWVGFPKPYTDPAKNTHPKDGVYLVWETTEMERVLPENRLYTVTTIASSDRFNDTRTPVICSTFEAAEEIVLGNHGDIWEYSYMFVVIEGVVPDVLYGHTTLDDQYWYVWIDDGYKPIECPKMYEGVVGWGIG